MGRKRTFAKVRKGGIKKPPKALFVPSNCNVCSKIV